MDDAAPSVAMDDAGNAVAVWQSGGWDGTRWNDADIYAARSSNNGQTWTQRTVLNSNADFHHHEPGVERSDGDEIPSLATDNHGTWLCVWLWGGPIGQSEASGHNILSARSSDNGATWSRAKVVNTDYVTPQSTRELPHLASDEHDRWICIWMAPYEESGDYFWGIFIAVSNNKGKSWSDPKRIGEGFDLSIWLPKVFTDCNGVWLATWLRHTVDGTIIDYTSSANNGKDWTTPQHIAPIGDAFYFEQYSVATDRLGRWMAIYNGESVEGAGIHETHSTDNAATWSVPGRVSGPGPATVDQGSAAIETDGNGRWIILWERSTQPFVYDFVFREANGDFLQWGRVKPVRKRDNWRITSKFNTVLKANRSGNWLAVWEWTHYHHNMSDTDSDLTFATKTFDNDLQNP